MSATALPPKARCPAHGGVDTLLPLDRRRTLMGSPASDAAIAAQAQALFAGDGVPASLIADSAGFVVQRVLASIVNIGCEIAQQGICSPTDLDLAVTAGLGYPQRPLAWGDALGAPDTGGADRPAGAYRRHALPAEPVAGAPGTTGDVVAPAVAAGATAPVLDPDQILV